MPEWWTYTLADFLMFSPRVYTRMFELHNGALWPAQLAAIGLGIVILYALLRPEGSLPRVSAAILGGLWIWVAWSFFWERYASINWAAAYVAPAFALEGFLLIWAGTVQGRLRALRRNAAAMAGMALFAAAVVAYPLLAPLMQRPWGAAEVFGIAPDPTAIATLALLAFVDGPRRWSLMAMPLAWCIISAATLWTMGEAADAAVVLAAALAAITIAIASSRLVH